MQHLTTLNREEVDKPLYFENDKEITVKGFQGADNQNVSSLNSRRLQEKEKLKLDYNIAPFTVDRHNVFNDLIVLRLTLKERTCMVKESLGIYFQNFSNLYLVLKCRYILLRTYNPMQNVRNKLANSSKIGQDKKSLVFPFACFLTATAKV